MQGFFYKNIHYRYKHIVVTPVSKLMECFLSITTYLPILSPAFYIINIHCFQKQRSDTSLFAFAIDNLLEMIWSRVPGYPPKIVQTQSSSQSISWIEMDQCMGKCQYSMGLIVYTSQTIMKCDGNTSIPGSIVEIPGPVFYIIRSLCSFSSVRKSAPVSRQPYDVR